MSQVWLKVSAGGGITSQFIILLQNILFGSDKIPNGPLYVDKGDILKRLYTDYLKEDEQVFFNLPNWWDAIFDQKKDHTIDNYFKFDEQILYIFIWVWYPYTINNKSNV